MNARMVITGAQCVTPLGLDALATVAAVRAGVSAVRFSEQFDDIYGEPILEGCMPWLPPEDEPEAEEPEVEPEIDAEAASEDAVEEPWDEPIPDQPEDEGEDPYELARQNDDEERVTGAAAGCLSTLLDAYLAKGRAGGGVDTMFLGVAPIDRPGPRFEGRDDGVAHRLATMIRQRMGASKLGVIKLGNAAAIEGVRRAASRLEQDPHALQIVGALDSLLALETLNWYEEAERLKSGSPGRHHGVAPAEGVGFVMLEAARSAQRAGRPVLAQVAGVGLAKDPNPFVSERPSRAEGLSQACSAAIADAGIRASDIGTVLCDMDGEFHRSKEWALASVRCFGGDGSPELLHPADCWGSLGAASSAVLMAVAAIGLLRGWFSRPVLVLCSDDTGFCGGVVLLPPAD
jgi:3-oxoacyl-[acyl-carrier-protein] synthase-1